MQAVYDLLVASFLTWVKTSGLNLVGAIVIVFLFWVCALIVRKLIYHFSERKHLTSDVIHILTGIVTTIILTFGVITALGTMGVNVSALVAGLGLTGFALGFALKDIISNILSGILILAYRPFKRNDRLFVSGVEGRVTKIDLRYTELQHDEKKILIPNSVLFTQVMTVVKDEQKK